MATRSIRSTLLSALFTNPRPIDRLLYNAARSELYPSESDFEAFLRTDNEQEMANRARTILLKLIFSANCPPPSHLVMNLAATQQEGLEVTRQGDYIPRDHFVHLVHLYLLGLYLFSYHNSMHRRCTADLLRDRRSETQRGHLLPVSPYRLFGVVWKQFVLYHDLGYPLERLVPSARKDKTYGQWLVPFSRSVGSLHKDLAFKAIARLVTSRSLLTSHDAQTFGRTFCSHLPYASLKAGQLVYENPPSGVDASVLSKWEAAVSLPNVNGPEDMRTVLSVIPDIDFCAYLESPSGAGELAVLGPIHSCEYFDPGQRKADSKIRKLTAKYSARTAILERGITPSGYRWQFFALQPSAALSAAVEGVMGNMANEFVTVASAIERADDYRAALTRGVDNADHLSALGYFSLLEMRGYVHAEDDEDLSPFEKSERLLRSIRSSREIALNEVSDIAAKVYGATVKRYADSSGRALLEALENDADRQSVARSVADFVGSQYSSVVAKLSDELEERIKTPLGERAAAKATTNHATKAISKGVASRSKGSNPYQDLSFLQSTTFSLDKALKRFPLSCEELDRRLSDRLAPLNKIIGSYIPSWVKRATDRPWGDKGEHFIDHGFASALLTLVSAAEYDACADLLQAAPNSHPARLLRMSFGMVSQAESGALAADLFLLKGKAVEAVVLHNLYPADLPDSTAYRTDMVGRPFAYLALLADSLQKWDRRSLVNEAKSQDVSVVPGSRYDLRVRDSLLYVRLSAERLDMRKSEDIRLSLKQFLRDGDSLIRLNFEEL